MVLTLYYMEQVSYDPPHGHMAPLYDMIFSGQLVWSLHMYVWSPLTLYGTGIMWSPQIYDMIFSGQLVWSPQHVHMVPPHVRYDFFKPASKESTACPNKGGS